MKKLVLLAFALLPVPALADSFVWTDPVDKLSISFPEKWMRQTNTNPETRLDILAPQGADFARCRVTRTTNAGFLSTPADGQMEVTSFKFTQDAVEKHLWRDPSITRLQVMNYGDIAGLGQAPAVRAQADFTRAWGAKDYDMTAFAFLSQHRGVVHGFVCETLTQAVGRWQPVFENILRSIEYAPGYGITPHGYYRAFDRDGNVIFPVDNGVRKTGAARD